VIEWVPIEELRPHEAIDEGLLDQMIEKLKRYGLKDPIVVDKETKVILDGHHRYAACKALGMRVIPCLLIDYRSPEISVEPRRPEIPVSKEEVIRRGLEGDLYPPKTTRHLLPQKLSQRV